MELIGTAPELTIIPAQKTHTFSRTDVINTLVATVIARQGKCSYLEIGTRDPRENFNKVTAGYKVGVEPGSEGVNPESSDGFIYKMTSDEFFEQNKTKFSVVFIDGLHISSQVWADINNALEALEPKGFIVLHDCNPPSWDRAHSDYKDFLKQPRSWNGDVWKAMYLARTLLTYPTFTIDTDEGCGVISTSRTLDKPVIPMENPFFSYGHMAAFRKQHLGLISVDEFLSNLDTLI